MGSCPIKRCSLLLLCLSLLASLSDAASISDGVIGSPSLGQRRLLQAQKRCPVGFELLNYTTLTNSCKGPVYSPKLCCPAFKEFACPYAQYLNDLSSDCASTMFSYINLRGRYPPGLFANTCKEGPQGLECPADPPGSSKTINKNSSSRLKNTWNLLLVGSFLLLHLILMKN